MNQRKIIRKLKCYLNHHNSLTNPKLVLDWVNDQGWESEIYAYTLTHGRSHSRISETGVMRLLTGADFEGAQSEYRTLSLLHQAGYPVPEVYALGSPKDGFKHPFILMQRVEGGDFSSRFPKTPENDLKPLRDFVALFRDLHTLDWRPYVENPDQIAPPNQPYYHFDRKLDLFSQYLEQSGLTALDQVMAWLANHRELAACDRASVVHQDFHPNNILEDREGNLFVVDWTSAEVSDYRFDLAWTLALTLAYGGNTRREMVLAEYERQMGANVPGLEVFEVIAFVRRIGSAMISMLVGAEKMGMRPEAAEVMRRDRVAFERLFQRLTAITGLELPEISAWVDTLG
jgi:aminoglycoside phosphotransferase (APT) family kinase protein